MYIENFLTNHLVKEFFIVKHQGAYFFGPLCSVTTRRTGLALPSPTHCSARTASIVAQVVSVFAPLTSGEEKGD